MLKFLENLIIGTFKMCIRNIVGKACKILGTNISCENCFRTAILTCDNI